MSINFSLPPPPVGNEVDSPSFRDWFFKIGALILAALNLSNATGILAPAHGGTGTSVIPANGKILIGNGVSYDVNNITAGTNISIVNGPGTITINSTGGGGSNAVNFAFAAAHG